MAGRSVQLSTLRTSRLRDKQGWGAPQAINRPSGLSLPQQAIAMWGACPCHCRGYLCPSKETPDQLHLRDDLGNSLHRGVIADGSARVRF